MRNVRYLLLVHLAATACAHPRRDQCNLAPAPPFQAVADTTPPRIIRGVVISALDSTPIFGARIRIAGTSIGALTDSLGRFGFTARDTAWVTIVGDGIGYRTNQLRLRLQADHGWLLQVTLVPYCTVLSYRGPDVWPLPNTRLKLSARWRRFWRNAQWRPSFLSAAPAGRSLSANR